jgi:hypothetical protein
LVAYYFAIQILITAAYWYAGFLEKRWNASMVLVWTAVLAGIGFLLTVVFHNPIGIFCSLLFASFVQNLREPFFAHAMNKRIASHNRATTLSSLWFIKSILDIPVLLLAGWLATQDLRLVFILAFILCMVTVFFLPVREPVPGLVDRVAETP